MLFLFIFTITVNTLLSEQKIYLSFINIEQIDHISVSQEISQIFGKQTEIIPTFANVEFAYIQQRQQYLADKILFEGIKFVPKNAQVLVFVVDKDIFTEGFNFIFGQSLGKVCVVSINRFLPCSEIDTQDEKKLVHDRTVKTIVHEIGHSFGLYHCKNPSCVMFFSNWVGETDRKTKFFCSNCRNKLNKKLVNMKGGKNL